MEKIDTAARYLWIIHTTTVSGVTKCSELRMILQYNPLVNYLGYIQLVDWLLDNLPLTPKLTPCARLT